MAFSEPGTLLDYLQLPRENFAEDIKARALFPLRVPRSFAARMSKKNPDDPLFKQVFTSLREFDDTPGYSSDPLQEQDNSHPGLLHKYQSRVLLIVRGGCAVNCRYCFRRHFPYGAVSYTHLRAHET